MKKFLVSLIMVIALTLTSFSQNLTIFTSEFTDLNGTDINQVFNVKGEKSPQIFAISLSDSTFVHILEGDSQLYKITTIIKGSNENVSYITFDAHSGLTGKYYTYTIINEVDDEGNDNLSLFLNLSVSDDLLYGGYFKVYNWLKLKSYER